MKVSLLALVVGTAFVNAVQQFKSVVVSYPDGTDQSTIDAAKQAILSEGGKINHDFTLFRGFSAMASAHVLEMSVASKGGAIVEEDITFHATGGDQ